MTADSSIYDSDRMAAIYAFSRPPVHRHIAERMARYLTDTRPAAAALDIGCGAGMSTAALVPLARMTVGLERHAPMLKYASTVARGAAFAVGCAEALPFAHNTFDLITAAGVLNYADLDLSVSEIARVLSPRGTFFPYDFSAGHRLRGDHRLGDWYEAFRRVFPPSPGYALNLQGIEYGRYGLDLIAFEEPEIGISMPVGKYVDYIMGESSVRLAVARGRSEADVRQGCLDDLNSMFSSGPREVIFDAQIACVRKRPSSQSS
jgi:SAM-dependent methyltransferase